MKNTTELVGRIEEDVDWAKLELESTEESVLNVDVEGKFELEESADGVANDWDELVLRELEVTEVSPELLDDRRDEPRLDGEAVLVKRYEDDWVKVFSVMMLVGDTVLDEDVLLARLDAELNKEPVELGKTELTDEELEALPVIVIFWYSVMPLLPPQISFGFPRHFMLHLPSVAMALP